MGRKGRGMSEKVNKPQWGNQGNTDGSGRVHCMIPSVVASV